MSHRTFNRLLNLEITDCDLDDSVLEQVAAAIIGEALKALPRMKRPASGRTGSGARFETAIWITGYVVQQLYGQGLHPRNLLVTKIDEQDGWDVIVLITEDARDVHAQKGHAEAPTPKISTWVTDLSPETEHANKPRAMAWLAVYKRAFKFMKPLLDGSDSSYQTVKRRLRSGRRNR